MKKICFYFRISPQRSHNSVKPENSSKTKKMVSWQGLEPWTTALKGRCSTD